VGFLFAFPVAGLILLFNGVVQLCIRKKTGLWKEGGASLLAGAIIAGILVFVDWLTAKWLGLPPIWWLLIIAGLVLAFNGVVQLCVRKKTGLWKEGGATLLAGAIIAGMLVFLPWIIGTLIVEVELIGTELCWSFATTGLVLASSGGVQLCISKKTGLWKDGGVSLLAGAIIVGILIGWMTWS
jgi:hypothetical protein